MQQQSSKIGEGDEHLLAKDFPPGEEGGLIHGGGLHKFGQKDGQRQSQLGGSVLGPTAENKEKKRII